MRPPWPLTLGDVDETVERGGTVINDPGAHDEEPVGGCAFSLRSLTPLRRPAGSQCVPYQGNPGPGRPLGNDNDVGAQGAPGPILYLAVPIGLPEGASVGASIAPVEQERPITLRTPSAGRVPRNAGSG
jgi:hypothetical protein